MSKKKIIILVTGFVMALPIGFVLYLPTHSQGTSIVFSTDGLHNIYHAGEPIRFTEIISGYDIPPCEDPVTQIFNIDDPTKPVFSDNGGNSLCLAKEQLVTFTKYYPAKDKPISIIINKTGVYKLKVSWDRIRTETSFNIIPPTSGNNNHTITNQTIINDVSYLDEIKNFTKQSPDWKNGVENHGYHDQNTVVYYTPTKLYNNTLGTISGPQYRTLKLLIYTGLVNNTAIPNNIELVCSVSSYDNKTETDYSLFPHDNLNLTFNTAIKSNICFNNAEKK